MWSLLLLLLLAAAAAAGRDVIVFVNRKVLGAGRIKKKGRMGCGGVNIVV
jgi:hypothetical protein